MQSTENSVLGEDQSESCGVKHTPTALDPEKKIVCFRQPTLFFSGSYALT